MEKLKVGDYVVEFLTAGKVSEVLRVQYIFPDEDSRSKVRLVRAEDYYTPDIWESSILTMDTNRLYRKDLVVEALWKLTRPGKETEVDLWKEVENNGITDRAIQLYKALTRYEGT